MRAISIKFPKILPFHFNSVDAILFYFLFLFIPIFHRIQTYCTAHTRRVHTHTRTHIDSPKIVLKIESRYLFTQHKKAINISYGPGVLCTQTHAHTRKYTVQEESTRLLQAFFVHFFLFSHFFFGFLFKSLEKSSNWLLLLDEAHIRDYIYSSSRQTQHSHIRIRKKNSNQIIQKENFSFP